MFHRLVLVVALLYVSNAPALESYRPNEIAPAARATKLVVDTVAGTFLDKAQDMLPASVKTMANSHPMVHVQQQIAYNLN